MIENSIGAMALAILRAWASGKHGLTPSVRKIVERVRDLAAEGMEIPAEDEARVRAIYRRIE